MANSAQATRPPRSHTPDNNDDSLPTPAFSSQESTGKQKQLPTITPRRFKRFFTPRTSLKRHVKIGSSRQVLRDITAGGANRRSRDRRPSLSQGGVQVLKDKEVKPISVSTKRKRAVPISPETTPDNSSPLKRIRGSTPSIQDDDDLDVRTDFKSVSSNTRTLQEEFDWNDELAPVKPIVRWKESGRFGRALRRECAADIGNPRRGLHPVYGHEWQHETTNFSTRPEDSHTCDNIAQTDAQYAIPFCTSSCNTNSLVAVGDEEGGIRLLDTEKGSKTPFPKPYLSFRPHTNAILDLSFSPDDLLLATASGDQTSRVIDMPTQRATYAMAGHASSVRKTCFQPGSSSVIVTSSRDGNVLMWDLRCKGQDGPVRDLRMLLASHDGEDFDRTNQQNLAFARPVNAILEAHAPTSSAATKAAMKTAMTRDARNEARIRRGDISVTSLAFLPAGREHLLLTGSEANASVKLWDLRTTYSRHRHATPLSSTRQPDSHQSHRHFGLTSMALSGDGARLYTACRDNTVYAYSTAHLILGSAPELSLLTTRSRRAGGSGSDKEGLGPLYGFRHPRYHATTFYVKSALRPAAPDHSELLAVGSSDGCAVLFPTDERYLPKDSGLPTLRSEASRPSLSKMDSGTRLFSRLNDSIPIYQQGTALIRGHNREVTDMTWTPHGELVTVGDDLTVRCWREGPGSNARDLRMGGETGGRRWGCGWAEADGDWDEDD